MIGQLLDTRYRIVQPLSSGGFGQTYLAEDTRRPGSPKCVVKQLRPPSNNLNTVQIARNLFEREAKILERLGQYDQIPQLFAYFEENQEFYLVQEFIPGHPCTQELLLGRPLSEDQVINLVTDVLEILVFVHGQLVIHRDIKPDNLIRRQTDSKIVLIDFGAVKEIATQFANVQGQRPPTVIGTPGYMPIEQFHGNPQFNSDIYAIGVVGIQALTGLSASDLSKLQNPNTPNTGEIIWRHRAQASPELADVLDKMVRFDCRQRYQSASEVLVDLKNLTNNKRQKPQLQSRKQLSFTLAGVGAAALIVVGGLSFTFYRQTVTAKAKDFYTQGIEKVERGEYRGAIADLDQVIQMNSNNGNAYFYRAVAYQKLGDNQEAIEDFTQALNNFKQEQYATGIGVQLERNQQTRVLTVVKVLDNLPAFNSGVKVGDQLIEIDGKSTTNMSVDDAINISANGKIGTSITLRIAREGDSDFNLTLNRAAIPNYSRAAIYNNRGRARFAQGDNKGAIEDYNQALRIDPNDSLFYFNRGLARSKEEDKQRAMEDFNKAIEINSNYSEAYYERGIVRRLLGLREKAIEDFNQAVQLQPKYAEAYLNRGMTHYLLGNMQAAISDYNQTIEINPNYTDAYLNRGAARSKQGDNEAAIEDYNQVIKLNPNSTDAYNNRGTARYFLKDYQGAIDDYTQAINLAPKDATPYSNRGGARYDLGDRQGAVDDYTKAIELKSDFANPYFNRGQARRDLGDKQGAVADFQKAANLYLEEGNQGGYNNALSELRKLQQ